MRTICTNLFSRNGRRKLLGLFALVVAAFMLPVFAEAACSFELPATWRTKTALWVGDCKAEGPSVVKETSDGKVVRFFFGRIQTGKWVLGVIDQSDGYLAGEFLNGRIDGQVERSVMIRAFDEAAKAAQSVAERYRKVGNLPSARFYQSKARELKNQMD